METHNTNLNNLIDIDNVIFPEMKINIGSASSRDKNKVVSFSSKVSVKGRNGSPYYVPVFGKYKIGPEDLNTVMNRFKTKCEIAGDHFITREGRDVLVEDYLKIKNYKTEYIGDDRV